MRCPAGIWKNKCERGMREVRPGDDSWVSAIVRLSLEQKANEINELTEEGIGKKNIGIRCGIGVVVGAMLSCNSEPTCVKLEVKGKQLEKWERQRVSERLRKPLSLVMRYSKWILGNCLEL